MRATVTLRALVASLFLFGLGVSPAHAAIRLPFEVFVVVLAGLAAIVAVMWAIIGLIYLWRKLRP